MTKILSGKELAGFIKERQRHQVASLKGQGIIPKLVIVRDSDNPVITKYVSLKQRYGADIGITVEDFFVNPNQLESTVQTLNQDPSVDAFIIQLPLINPEQTEKIVSQITPKKDVDNLSEKSPFDSATAEAINWLLAGYDIDLKTKKIAIVGKGKLVGAPLLKILQASNFQPTVFVKGDDLTKLAQYDVIITATGVPHLITDKMVSSGTTIIDAGTASENGVLKGDVDDSVRSRDDLKAITPIIGGVGPLTVSVLFDHVITAASDK